MRITIRNQPDYRYECLCILERAASSADQPGFQSTPKERDYYARKYHLSESESAEYFDGLIHIYEHVLQNLQLSSKILETDFAPLPTFGASPARLVLMIDKSLSLITVKEEWKDAVLAAQILAAVTDNCVPEPPEFKEAEFPLYLQNLDCSPSEKWSILEILLSWATKRQNLLDILDRAAVLFAEKADLIAPLLDRWNERMTRIGEKGAEEFLKKIGIKLDCRECTLIPCAIPFSATSIWADSLFCSWMGMPDTAEIYMGILVDLFISISGQRVDENDRLVAKLKAIGDPKRLLILQALKNGAKNGKELADITGLSAPTVSHHMSELISHELVTMEKEGTSLRYSFSTETFRRLLKDLSNNLQ